MKVCRQGGVPLPGGELARKVILQDAVAAEKSGKSIDEVWSAPFDIRIRRDSPYPTNRKLSAAAALLLKADEEKRLAEAVAKADAERRAVRPP